MKAGATVRPSPHRSSPSPGDPVYHTPKEVTLELFKAFASGIELVRDQKLGKPLGPTAAEAKPKLAAFLQSVLRQHDRQSRWRYPALQQGRFARVVADDSPGVEDSILFDLNHAIEVLRGMDKPFAEVASDDTLRAKLEALRVGLTGGCSIRPRTTMRARAASSASATRPTATDRSASSPPTAWSLTTSSSSPTATPW